MSINRTAALPICVALLLEKDADCCFLVVACLTATSDPISFFFSFFVLFPQALIFSPTQWDNSWYLQIDQQDNDNVIKWIKCCLWDLCYPVKSDAVRDFLSFLAMALVLIWVGIFSLLHMELSTTPVVLKPLPNSNRWSALFSRCSTYLLFI